MTEQVVCFGSITPAHWEYMTGDRNDGYSRKMWWARRWLAKNRERREVLAMIRQVEDLQRCSLFRRQGLA